MVTQYDIYRCDRDVGKYSTENKRAEWRKFAVKHQMTPKKYVQIREWVDEITAVWRTAL